MGALHVHNDMKMNFKCSEVGLSRPLMIAFFGSDIKIHYCLIDSCNKGLKG